MAGFDRASTCYDAGITRTPASLGAARRYATSIDGQIVPRVAINSAMLDTSYFTHMTVTQQSHHRQATFKCLTREATVESTSVA
jgi:hypothetical protein